MAKAVMIGAAIFAVWFTLGVLTFNEDTRVDDKTTNANNDDVSAHCVRANSQTKRFAASGILGVCAATNGARGSLLSEAFVTYRVDDDFDDESTEPPERRLGL
jgi:hypothetical protein